METIGAFEAKTHFSALLARIGLGEQFIITKHGKQVARLVPVEVPAQEKKQALIEKYRQLGAKNTLGGLSWKALRDEGRR